MGAAVARRNQPERQYGCFELRPQERLGNEAIGADASGGLVSRRTGIMEHVPAILRPSDSLEDAAPDASRRWTLHAAADDYSAGVPPGIFHKDRRRGVHALDATSHHSAFFVQRKLRASIPHERAGL